MLGGCQQRGGGGVVLATVPGLVPVGVRLWSGERPGTLVRRRQSCDGAAEGCENVAGAWQRASNVGVRGSHRARVAADSLRGLILEALGLEGESQRIDAFALGLRSGL